MIDFKHLFDDGKSSLNQQKKIAVDCALGVYFGYSNDGYLRLSFLSKINAPHLESTKDLRIAQGEESIGVFWTCFDLLNQNTREVFYAFCENMVDSVSGILDESLALSMLKRRYISWKSMFKGTSGNSISREILQGLYGELFFLKNFMLEKFGAVAAVNSWSGPDSKSKDYSINREWYEIKTVGANSTTVHISSLSQLSSPYTGHLVIIKTESMSQGFDNGESCIKELFTYILSQINDETAEGVFLSKMYSYGIDLSDSCFTEKFCVKSFNRYLVDEHFPKLTESDISNSEICDVNYSLIINSLNGYLEE